jgi:hypothetical protein
MRAIRRARLAAIACAGLATSGCAANGVFTSAGDFSAYRATRVEPTFELRLAAAQRYLKDRPNGGFRHEVRAWFDHAEELYYASKRNSRTGLRAYLDALPDGPHKEEAEIRLAELDNHPSELERTAASVEKRLAGPQADARAGVRRELGDWLARWLDAGAFGVPLWQAKADLVIAYALALPRPRCEMLDPPQAGAVRRCAKLLSLPYEVEGDRGDEKREATLEVAVLEDETGRPLEVSIGGPDLFLRVEETYRIKPIAPDDAEARKAASKRLIGLVTKAFQRSVSSGDGCRQKAEPPAAVRLGCEGLQLELFPAASPGADDLITIVPLARAEAGKR